MVVATALLAAVVTTAAGAAVRPTPAAAHTIQPSACARVAGLYAEPDRTRLRTSCQRKAAAHRIHHDCWSGRPLPLVGAITVKGRRGDFEQRRTVTVALNTGRAMRVPVSHQIAMLAAGAQESSLRPLAYGDGTSVGFLQLIDTHEPAGTNGTQWRLNVTNSAGWFLRGAAQVDPRGRVAPGLLAQMVQRSAHPTLYHQWVPEARRTYATFMRVCRT